MRDTLLRIRVSFKIKDTTNVRALLNHLEKWPRLLDFSFKRLHFRHKTSSVIRFTRHYIYILNLFLSPIHLFSNNIQYQSCHRKYRDRSCGAILIYAKRSFVRVSTYWIGKFCFIGVVAFAVCTYALISYGLKNLI